MKNLIMLLIAVFVVLAANSQTVYIAQGFLNKGGCIYDLNSKYCTGYDYLIVRTTDPNLNTATFVNMDPNIELKIGNENIIQGDMQIRQILPQFRKVEVYLNTLKKK